MEKESLISKDENQPFRSERIILSKGEEVGWHITHEREEIIFITKGTASFMDDSGKTFLSTGDSHIVSEGIRHNIANEQEEDLEYVYIVKIKIPHHPSF